jgi:outer membrane protein assembly factor BamB
VASLGGQIVSLGGGAISFNLSQEGLSLWRGTVAVASLEPGAHDLTVTGTFADGSPIQLQQELEYSQVVPIVRAPGGDWPMFRKTAAGSSFVAERITPPLTLIWSRPLPGMVALSSPVVAGDRVLLGCRTESGNLDDSGVLCCNASTGAVHWFTPVPGGVALAPAVVGSTVLVSSMADSVVALDLATGASLWRSSAPGNKYKMTAPVFEGNTAWIGSEPTPIQIDVATGGTTWISEALGASWYPAIYSAPAVGPQYVYYGFYGVRNAPPDGFSIVARSSGSPVHHENGTFRSPIVTDDRVFLVGGETLNDQFLSARDVVGNVLWTSSTPLGRSTGSPALGHDVIVVAGEGGRVEGIRSTDGAHLWSHTVGYSLYDMSPNRRRNRDTIGTPAITDDVVYVGSLDGNLYALDLATGTELWRWHLGVPIASSPAASGRMLFVGASDAHLYAFAEVVMPAIGAPFGTGRPGSAFAFYPPTPNPSRAGVRFEWVVPRKGRVTLEIFDVAGRRVRTVLDGPRDPGEQFVVWDGRGEGGAALASGVYLARIQSGSWVATRKLVHIRP